MMSPEAVGLLITAIFGGIASIIYSFKSVKKSTCCGATCEQTVTDSPRGSVKKPATVIQVLGDTQV
jgi:hypothetical protein